MEKGKKKFKIIDNDEKEKNHRPKVYRKNRGLSLQKLASIELDEKINELLPNMGNRNKKSLTTIVKNVFHQNYQNNIKIKKLKENLSEDIPVKIMSSFGRTGYTFYDKKEEGINNLINKGIKKTINKYKNNSSNLNLELSPVTKIKVYGNI